MGKKKEKERRAVVYLSVKGNDKTVSLREQKQLKYILEYAKAHHIKIVKIMHRDILGIGSVNIHFNEMLALIKTKKVEIILINKMASISKNIEDAYGKIGRAVNAGGAIVTVDEGNMKLPLRMNLESKKGEGTNE